MMGERLDLFLSKGYFRMQQEVFTCQFIPHNDMLCPVHWLRIDLARMSLGPKQRRLYRINESFNVQVRPFYLSAELRGLYALYRQSIDFDAPESIESCLLGSSTHNVFDTRIVEVRDSGKLIAAGVFDNGLRSIAGIMNFYDPHYRKQSLGKYLMLLKIRFAQQQQKDYYYPGYIASNYPKFDYKLFACEAATDVYDANNDVWHPFSWELIATLAEIDNFLLQLMPDSFRYNTGEDGS